MAFGISIYTYPLTKTKFYALVKNIDISSQLCSGSYPYTLCFLSSKYLVFVFGEDLEKHVLENTVFQLSQYFHITKIVQIYYNMP